MDLRGRGTMNMQSETNRIGTTKKEGGGGNGELGKGVSIGGKKKGGKKSGFFPENQKKKKKKGRESRRFIQREKREWF